MLGRLESVFLVGQALVLLLIAAADLAAAMRIAASEWAAAFVAEAIFLTASGLGTVACVVWSSVG